MGVAFAGALSENAALSAAGAFTLSIGIAIQNFPEGAIISMPLSAEGMGKKKAFMMKVVWSGRADRSRAYYIAGGICQTASSLFPSFAAGAMLYVVVEGLICGAFGRGDIDISVP